MHYEHLPGDRFTFNKGENYYLESDEAVVNTNDVLPITEMLRDVSHEKFIIVALVAIGIGKLLLFAKIYHLI